MKLVLDTNIVLDLLVFRDARIVELEAAIAREEVSWLATAAMREELACVLGYEQLGRRLDAAQLTAHGVLDAFDAAAKRVDVPVPTSIACRDPDDQKFIDLAVAHGATLLSKDKDVLALRRKLAAVQVTVAATL